MLVTWLVQNALLRCIRIHEAGEASGEAVIATGLSGFVGVG